MTVNEQLNYTSKNSWEVGTDFVLPMLSKGSMFVYLGSYVSPTIQGGVLVVEKDDFESFDGSLKTEDILYANESYTFTLVFGEESIELTGNRCEWENGGYLIVPIYPTVN